MIEINDKWAIGSNAMNIVLYRKYKTDKDSSGYKFIEDGYYGTLRGATTALVNQDIRDSGLTTLKELTNKINEVELMIKNLPNITVADLSNAPDNGADATTPTE